MSIYNLGLVKDKFTNLYTNRFDAAVEVIIKKNPNITQINLLSYGGLIPKSKHVIRKGRWYYYRTETKDIYIKVCTPVKDKYAKTCAVKKIEPIKPEPMSSELVKALTETTIPSVPISTEPVWFEWDRKEKKDE